MEQAADISSFIALLLDNDKYKERVLELRALIKQADEAERSAKAEQDRLASVRADTEQALAKVQGQLENKQKAHDDAAREAKARIEVGRQQQAELLKQQADIGVKTQMLEQREAALAQREKEIKTSERSLNERAVEIDRVNAVLAERRKKAEAFLAS